MVARINREMFGRALHTPDADVFDSEGVLLALETARSLEEQGDIREVARWLGRAADQATKQGNDERALVLAQAAADCTNAIEATAASAAAPSSVPTLNIQGRKSRRVPRQEHADAARLETPPPSQAPAGPPVSGMPPMLAALVSSIPPFSTRRSSSRPPSSVTSGGNETSAPPVGSRDASAPISQSAPSVSAANDAGSAPEHKPITARTVRIGAIRVAITGSIEGAKSFSVERLEKGQPLPAGATEGMLVLTGAVDRSIVKRANVSAAKASGTKR
jgi:hypothetical protein